MPSRRTASIIRSAKSRHVPLLSCSVSSGVCVPSVSRVTYVNSARMRFAIASSSSSVRGRGSVGEERARPFVEPAFRIRIVRLEPRAEVASLLRRVVERIALGVRRDRRLDGPSTPDLPDREPRAHAQRVGFGARREQRDRVAEHVLDLAHVRGGRDVERAREHVEIVRGARTVQQPVLEEADRLRVAIDGLVLDAVDALAH